MAVLDQLRITDASPRRDLSPTGRFRRRLVEALRLQIQLANADSAGVPLNRTRQRWVKTGEKGEKELRQVPVRLRRWWWQDDAGKTYLSLKYGARPLEIAPGKKAIEIGEIGDLPVKLNILCEAVLAGELDACASAASAVRPNPKKEKKLAPSKLPISLKS